MKRRRGESCVLKNDRGASSGALRPNFPTMGSQYFECLDSDLNGEDSFWQHQKCRPRRDTERNTMRNSQEMGAIRNSEARTRRKRRDFGPRKGVMSAAIAILAFSSIAGTSCVAVPPTTATLAQTVDQDLPTAHGLHLRNLQTVFKQCIIALAIGDIDRDDLLSKNEYLRFVNQLSSRIPNSDYVEVSDFDRLPQSLRNNFDSFSDSALSRIDIYGAKPGQVPTSQQETQINNLCESTSTTILVSGGDDPVKPVDPYPNNDNNHGTGTDCSAAIDRGRCNVDLSISDSSQNNLLDESDYVKFVNRIASNQYSNTQIGQLPLNIKNNYYMFATKNGQVDISGSKPGQRVSVEQDIFLNVFCCETEKAVENPGSSEDPVDLGPGPATPAPTFDLFFCQRSMASSDLNRDDGLSEDEYVIFLNRLTNNRYVGQTYDGLDVVLQANFVKLSGDDNKIDIYGSKPGQAANFQNENELVNVCVETGNTLNAGSTVVITPSPVVQPTVSPTLRPNQNQNPTDSPISPTFAPGRSEVFNSFIISNSDGFTASDLTVGTNNRDGLDEAYGTFVQNAVESYAELNGNLEIRALRRRKLVVALLPDSDQIYRIENTDCPEGFSFVEKCQTAFASFQLTLEGENAKEISDLYTDFTQKLIQEGELQVILKTVDESTVLKIVNASYPVTPQVEETTKPPTSAPNVDEKKKKRNLAGPIVGSLFAVLILAAIVYVCIKGLPFELPFEIPFELPSFPKRGGARVGNKADEDDEDDMRLGLQDDDDPSIGDKNGFGKDFGMDSRNSLGAVDEDDGDQKDKNLFGFPTRKKVDEEVDINYGLPESNQNLNTNSADVSDDLYAFEEPSEIDSETDNQDDQRSAAENDDIVFGGKTEPSNWGSDNVFESESSNQGWGANGGEENFFGASAFGESQEEEEEEENDSSPSRSEESESYSSEDDTYESGDMDETTENISSEQDSRPYEEVEQQDSFSGSSSADDSYNDSSVPSSKMTSDLRLKNDDMDAAIDNGDWDAVVEAAKAFDKNDQDLSLVESSKRMALEETDEDIGDESYSESYTDDESVTSQTTTSEDRRKREEYRAQVDELVKIVLPNETEKVDAMMDQFKGREAELVSTLQTMEERSSNQRARAAIHKSKPPSQQESSRSYHGSNSGSMQGEGSTAGTAAIAAASLPIPTEGSFGDSQGDDFGDGFADENTFGVEGDDQYDEVEGSEYDVQSYYSEEDSQASGSFYSEEEESASRSYYSEEGSPARSFYSQEEEGPSQEGSFYSQEEGSGSQQRSFYIEEEEEEEGESMAESYYSEEEGSQSYYSEEGASYVSEGDEGSFYNEEKESPPNDQQ